MLLEKDSPRPLVFKNGLTFKNPIIGIGDIGINVGGLGIYESTLKTVSFIFDYNLKEDDISFHETWRTG